MKKSTINLTNQRGYINEEGIEELKNELKNIYILTAIEKDDVLDIDFEVDGLKFKRIERIGSYNQCYFTGLTYSNEIYFLELTDALKFKFRVIDINTRVFEKDFYTVICNDILYVRTDDVNGKLINLNTDTTLVDFEYQAFVHVIGESKKDVYISATNPDTSKVEVIHLIDGCVYEIINTNSADEIKSPNSRLFFIELEEGALLQVFKYSEESGLFEKLMVITYFINSNSTDDMMIYRDDTLYHFDKSSNEETVIHLFEGYPTAIFKLSDTYNYQADDYLVGAVCNEIYYLLDFKGNIIESNYDKFIPLYKANKLDLLLSHNKDNFSESIGYTRKDGTVWYCDLITKEKRKLHLESTSLKFKSIFCR